MKKMFVLMIALAIVATPVMAAEMLTNGNFETGDLTGWTTWGAPWGGPYTTAVQDAVVAEGGFALNLATNNGSCGIAQSFATVPGATYTISGSWFGGGALDWVEVLFFNDDGRALYDQVDAPANSSIITKVDGWGMNNPQPTSWVGVGAPYFFPSGNHMVSVVATGPTMWVSLKAGSVSSVNAYFDAFSVQGPAVPEPSSIVALLSGLGAMGFGLRRRIR